MNARLLDVRNLKTVFNTEDGVVAALDNISFYIDRGETVGLVGESGCGKSVTALSIMRILSFNGSIQEGSILFNGEDLVTKSARKMREIRGNEISMIFQEPMTSLNPVYTVGNQLVETIRRHQKVDKAKSLEIAVEALKSVGIPAPERRVREYPHELSGGMRQRVMIAMALACQPKLLIADEPTTALDVTIQAQILEILKDLKKKSDMSMMLITHDLGVVAETCDRLIVMYGGKIVEEGKLSQVLRQPLHPYTEGLLQSIPRLEGDLPKRLPVIPGMVPQLSNMPPGCHFNPRCKYVMAICREREPIMNSQADGRRILCWKFAGNEGE
ncbi:MAG: ABC transporter ATP-binding protein [Deltaproteobacteria bacterium]|nr:ABC transporter ATP-binding protein [Deltaproteobacteria bacterium]